MKFAWLLILNLVLVPALHADEEFSRGKALFQAAGCINCHSSNPGAPNATPDGGRGLVTAFGTFFPPNITADLETGIGKWSDQDFLRAMREGVRPDHLPYYPVFPYRSYSKMSEEDLLAIKSYLFYSVPTVSRPNRPHQITSSYMNRLLVWGWQYLYFPRPMDVPQVDQKIASGPFEADPLHPRSWNRGAYLVESVAHCTECHTPRGQNGQLEISTWMAGTASGPDGKPVPNITSSKKFGTGNWTLDGWQTFLRTGRTPRGLLVRGEDMRGVLIGLKDLSDADITSIAEYMMSVKAIDRAPYLKTTPAEPVAPAVSAELRKSLNTQNAAAEGLFVKSVYPFMRKNCAECHSEDAVYPVGPPHSHSNPALAFRTFERFVDWNNVNNSRIIKLVNMKHFCKDYGYNCANQDQVATQFTALMTNYFAQIKAVNAGAAPVSEAFSQNKIPSTQNLSAEAAWRSTEGSMTKADIVATSMVVKDVEVSIMGNTSLTFVAVFKRFSEDYYRLQSLDIQTDKGIFDIRGAEILINGQVPAARSGLDDSDRIVYAPKPLTQRFVATHPIYQLHPGDKIQLTFKEITRLKSFPTKLCKEKNGDSHSFVPSYYEIAQMTTAYMSETEICMLVESMIKFNAPRRSVYIEQVRSSRQNLSDYEMEDIIGQLNRFIKGNVKSSP